MKSKSLYIDLALGIALPIIIAVLLLYPILLKPGYIFYGDTIYAFYANSLNVFKESIYSWSNGGPTSAITLIFNSLVSLFLFFGDYAANKIFTFALAMLPGVATYFSIKYTLKSYGTGVWAASISAAAGSIFYLVNWQNQGLITPEYTWSMSYIIMPVLVYFFFRLITQYRMRDALILGALTAVSAAVPMWMLLMLVLLALYAVYELAQGLIRLARGTGIPWRGLARGLYIWMVFVASVVAFNAYWLLEAIFGFVTHVGGQYAAYTSTSSMVGSARYLSFYHMIDVLMYGQPTFQFFGYNPQNWTIMNIFIPMAAIIPILVLRKRKEPLFLLMVALVGVFLAKGFNPPLGFLYYYVIKLSPVGIIGITRDVTPWIQLTSVAYAFLIAMGLFAAIWKLRSYTQKAGSKGFRALSVSRKNVVVGLVIVIVVAGSLVASAQQTHTSLEYYTYTKYAPTWLPNYYVKLLDELYALHINGNVMWIPVGGVYSWKNDSVLTGWGLNLYPNSTPSYYIYPYLLQTNGTHLGKLLSLSDTAYLVYQSPGEPYAFNGLLDSYNQSYVIQRLLQQADLKLVFQDGGVWLFKNLENVSLIYAGIPDAEFPYASNLPWNNPTIPSNIWTNTSDLVALELQLDLLNYSYKYNFSSLPPGGTLVEAAPGSLVIYGSQSTPYSYNASLLQSVNFTRTAFGYNLTVSFNLPAYIADAGIKGSFNPSFGPVIDVFPWNQTPTAGAMVPANRLAASFPYSWTFLNSTSGYFSFSMPALDNVSIYVWYHGGSFYDLSPEYYLGSVVNGRFAQEPIATASSPPQEYEYTNSSPSLIRPYLYIESPPELVNGAFHMNSIIYYPTALYSNPNPYSPAAMNVINYSNIIPVITGGVEALPVESQFSCCGYEYPSNAYLIPPNSTAVLSLKTPLPGNYSIYVRAVKGLALINGSPVSNSTVEFSEYVEGSYNLSISTLNRSADVSAFAILPRLNPSIQLSDVKAVNPATYTLYYSSNASSLIILTQPFSNAWILKLDGTTYHPISIYNGMATGFVLPAGNGDVSISYLMQVPLDFGIAVTAMSFLALLAYLIYEAVRRRI
jgi:hypothetical protein